MPGSSDAVRLLRLHLGLAAAFAICASGFTIELLRALGGNALSWAYVFEWPLFLGYAIYMWRRLVTDEHRAASGLPDAVHQPRRPRRASAVARAERRAAQESIALEAWNAYLREANAPDRGANKPG
jgi:hypothetical protein